MRYEGIVRAYYQYGLLNNMKKNKKLEIKNIVIGLWIALALFGIICFVNFAIQSTKSNDVQTSSFSENSEISQ